MATITTRKKFNVPDEVAALFRRIEGVKGTQPTGGLDAYFAEQEAIRKEFDRIDKKNSPGLHAGRLLHFQVADGYAVYYVLQVNSRTVDVAHVGLGDAYHSPAVSESGTVPRSTAERVIKAADGMRALVKKSRDETEVFYDGLKVGDTVHARTSGWGWVRYEVVIGQSTHMSAPGKCLKPIAMIGTIRHEVDGKWIGEWAQYDVYTVSRTGEVTHGYHAKDVLQSHLCRPRPEEVWESGKCRHKPDVAPPDMPVIDLNPPAKTARQAQREEHWRKLEEVVAILNTNDRDADPYELMRRARYKLAAALSLPD